MLATAEYAIGLMFNFVCLFVGVSFVAFLISTFSGE